MVGFFQKTLCISLGLILLAACETTEKSIHYESDHLRVEQLSENVFLHVSYLKTNDFGKVSCNGAVFKSGDEALIIDTPTNDEASDELIRWVNENLGCKVVGVIPTHFHDDCLGGIASFDSKGIKSYAQELTIQLAKDDSVVLASNPFDSLLTLEFGKEKAMITFFGRGHTYDNVVAYYPKEETLFGGCLIKSIGAGKGYLGNADTLAWSTTVNTIEATYDNLRLIIPGHGKPGDKELLTYTSKMFAVEGE